MIFEIVDLDPNIKTRTNLIAKLKFSPLFMKFDTLNKSNMLNINTLIEIDDPDSKLLICKI